MRPLLPRAIYGWRVGAIWPAALAVLGMLLVAAGAASRGDTDASRLVAALQTHCGHAAPGGPTAPPPHHAHGPDCPLCACAAVAVLPPPTRPAELPAITPARLASGASRPDEPARLALAYHSRAPPRLG